MGNRLSVAMIVKNEALLLPECLNEAAQWADELCVVDTGSTDDTRSILAGFPCRTAEIEWGDDFAAARNSGIEMCTGDWIFVLDADERIAPEYWPALRGLCEGPPDRGYRFETRNYTDRTNVEDFTAASADPYGRGFPGWYPSIKVRLFPNAPDLRFEGVIHELINASLIRAGLSLDDSSIPVLHYPLLKSQEHRDGKLALYLRLSHQKCVSDPGNASAFGELGDLYLEAQNAAKAAAAYREAVRIEPENPKRLSELGTALFLAGREPQARSFLEAAIARDQDRHEAWRNLGILHANHDAWGEAARCFEEVRRCDPADVEIIRYAALAQHKLNNHLLAWNLCNQALLAEPDHGSAQELWISIVKADDLYPQARTLLRDMREKLSGDVADRLARQLESQPESNL